MGITQNHDVQLKLANCCAPCHGDSISWARFESLAPSLQPAAAGPGGKGAAARPVNRRFRDGRAKVTVTTAARSRCLPSPLTGLADRRRRVTESGTVANNLKAAAIRLPGPCHDASLSESAGRASLSQNGRSRARRCRRRQYRGLGGCPARVTDSETDSDTASSTLCYAAVKSSSWPLARLQVAGPPWHSWPRQPEPK